MTDTGGAYDLSPLGMQVSDDVIRAYGGGKLSTVAFNGSTLSFNTIIVMTLVLVIGAPLFVSLLVSGEAIGYLIAAVVFGVSVFFAVRWLKKLSRLNAERLVRLTTFAQVNRLQYFREVPVGTGELGMIFQLGDERMYDELVSFDLTGDSTMFGNYRYYTGSGKNRSKIETGFLRIRLNSELPQIVLDGVRNNWHPFGKFNFTNLPVTFSKDQALSLEGDFDKYFKLYVPKGYETDALYVFAPDLMALFIDNLPVYDAEIVGHWLYIYTPRLDLTNVATMKQIFSIIDIVGRKILRQTDHYDDGRVTTMERDPAREKSLRLKKGVRWGATIVSGLILLYYVAEIVLRAIALFHASSS